MEKYELEFPLNTSSSLLYKRLATPGGLGEWFADDVLLKKDKFTFIWKNFEQTAILEENKKNEKVKFRWEDSQDNIYFEFAIRQNSLTGDNALIITDFAENQEDKEDSIQLWEKQIAKLKNVLGLS
jgi:hypothetical protein